MMKTLIPLALTLLPAAAPLAAHAQPQTMASVRVSYADLDLSRAEGRAALDLRLARALAKVCPAEGPGYLTPALAARRCRTATRQQIVEARQQALASHAGAVEISANP